MALKFRRGTTAQKSGSLAFGEPYVNTTLGTLQIGLDTGDVTLTSVGPTTQLDIQSVSASSFVSASTIFSTGGIIAEGGFTGSIDFDNLINLPTLISGSSQLPLGLVSGSEQIVDILIPLNVFSASMEDKNFELATYTGSNNTINDSQNARLDHLSIATSSLDNSVSNLNLTTASLLIKTSNLESFTSSIDTTIKTKLDAEGVISGSSQIDVTQTDKYSTLATTGSNTFIGTQIITGSTYISGDLIVQGSSSLQNITASAVSIGTNIIYLNTDTPAVRFAGLSVFDSGSTGATGSLFYDSENERWLYQKSSGSSYSGGMLISGPRNTGLLGEEVGMPTNKLIMGIGGDHISSSNIYHDGNNTAFAGNVEVTGSIKGQILSTNGVVSGSSQIDISSTTGDVALGTRTSGNYVASLVAGTGVTITNNSGEGATPTIAIGQSVATNATPTFGNLTISGTITATGDITAFFTSDRRHKNNIQIIPNALEKVSKLNGVTWEWNDDVNEVTKSTPKTGLIAQEVQEVLPEVIKEREDGFLSLDYSKMMGLMVEAIKEQQTQIHNLTLQIEELKKQKGL